MKTIPEIFLARALRAGSKIAVRIHGGNDPATAQGLSYAQFYALLVNKSRLYDTELALPPAATVAIVADNSLDYLVAAYSAIFAGRPVFVVSTKSLPEHLAYFLQRSQAAHVFCSAAQRELCSAAMQATDFLDPARHLSDLAAFAPAQHDLHASEDVLRIYERAAPAESATAVILHTSGTTRTPKLVYLSHRNILANQLASDSAFRNYWTADSVSLGWLPLFHGYALLAEFLRDMIAGGTWVHYPAAGQVSADALLQAINHSGTNVLCCVPWMLNLIQEKIRSEGDDGAALRTMKQLKFIVTGGSNLGTTLGDFYRERGVRIVTMFGLSEAAGFVLHSPFDGSAWDELLPNAAQGVEFIPIAEAAREHELVLTDADLFSCKVLYPPGESAPDARSERLETGDLFLRKGSGWTYLGRGDQVYNGAHGEKVNPLLFELGLEQFEAVQKVFVFGEEMAFNVALVKLNPGYVMDAELSDGLNRYIQDRVNPALENPDRVYPGDVYVLGPDEAMPLTPKGSVNRREAARILKQRVEARTTPTGGGVANAATVAAILQRELATYLRPGEVAIAEATLLELGFDSLMTLSLRNNLQEKLRLQIPVALMLAYPPLKEFELELIALNEQAGREGPRHVTQQVEDAEGWRCIALEQVIFHHAYYLFPGPTFGGSFSLVAPRRLAADEIERGLRFLERNHEVLRSVYREDGRFRIAEHSMIGRAFIGHCEMRGSHDLNENLAVQALIQNDFALQHYNFADGAAWRYATVDLTNADGETRTMLFIGINHIIGDFRTFSLMVHEFMHYIDGRVGEAEVVPDPYRAVLASAEPDHIPRMQRAMQTLLTARFAEIPQGSDPRRGARLRFNFRDIDMTALSDAFRASNISVFNGVYTAWIIAASRHIDGLALEDFPSVTSVTTRISKELETVMGCFVYTPIYRFQLDAAASMKTNAIAVQQTTLEAFKGVLVNPVDYFERALADERNLMPIIKRNVFLYRSPDELIEPVPSWGCYRNDYFEDRCNVGAYFDFCANKADNTMEGYLTVNLLFCAPETARRVLNEVELLMKAVLRNPKLDFIPAQLLRESAVD
ncbi:MAG: hypothetical protein RLZZ227_433 [Pseudomonadota bacterium]|jgi:long-subunit acyl-CoA synthetase (AMP-forming)/acyl carrier protein